MCNYTYLCNRLHLFKNCLCCFLVKHLYSNNLSTIATISTLIVSELFPACFAFSNYFSLSHIWSELDGKKMFKYP